MSNDQCRAAFEKWKTRPDVVLWLSKAGARAHAWRIWLDAWESSRDHLFFAAAQPAGEAGQEAVKPSGSKTMLDLIDGAVPQENSWNRKRPSKERYAQAIVETEGLDSNLPCGALHEPTVIERMVNRFLGWKLPTTFGPDCYITFDRERAKANNCWPVGTNLLTADEAHAMFTHALTGISQPSVDAQWVAKAEELVHTMQRKYRNAMAQDAADESDPYSKSANAKAAWAEYHAARKALRDHLNSALGVKGDDRG